MQNRQCPTLGLVGPADSPSAAHPASFLNRFLDLGTTTAHDAMHDIPKLIALGYRTPLRVKHRSRSIFAPDAFVPRDKSALCSDLGRKVGFEAMDFDAQVIFQIIQIRMRNRDFVARKKNATICSRGTRSSANSSVAVESLPPETLMT